MKCVIWWHQLQPSIFSMVVSLLKQLKPSIKTSSLWLIQQNFVYMFIWGKPFRSSHQKCSVRKGLLRNFAKFTGKYLCQSLFFTKVAGLRPESLLKIRLWYKCFPVNFAKFVRTLFLQNTSGWLILAIVVLLF